MHILIVLPYSGNQFGGGLAVLNQKLTKALAGQGHKVKLVTMELPAALMPVADEHAPAEIVIIANEKTRLMHQAGGPKGDADRNLLYELINDPKIILQESVIGEIKKGGFDPKLIIGHSRFSGPAAIQLKSVFPSARAEYFLHSFPVEGSALVGYEAYDEASVNSEVAAKKMKEEGRWMPKADVIIGMGPLITAGALLILEDEKVRFPRVHEAVPGIELKEKYQPVKYERRVVPDLLLCGRGSAPIKGLEDLLLSVRTLWDEGCPVHVDVLWWAEKEYVNRSGPRTMGTDYRNLQGGRGQWVSPGAVEQQAFRRNAPWVEEAIDKDDLQIPFTTRSVDIRDAQGWIDEMMGISAIASELSRYGLERLVTLLEARKGDAVEETYRAHDATLMPSYIEHFGLVPFESLSHGVPVLCNRVSGAGMFLGDNDRFPTWGPPCVVNDFAGSMRHPRDFLVDIPVSAFDQRPVAWANAIKKLVGELPLRFEGARTLRRLLSEYTYEYFAASIVTAADPRFDRTITKQGGAGAILPRT